MKYVLTCGDKFIGIDRQSGGYPYLVDSGEKAHIWNYIEEAEKYAQKFSETYRFGNEWKLHRIIIQLDLVPNADLAYRDWKDRRP